MRQLRSSRQIPPALAQSNSAAPANVAARNGANIGEAIVSWTPNAAAVSNRVGWANISEVQAAQAAGNWLEAFNFVEIGGAKNSYTVKRLEPGTQHAFIVATIAANGAYTYSEWIFLTTAAAPAPTPCPTPGAGGPHPTEPEFCPITGFALGDGYMEIGQTAEWSDYELTITSAVIHPFGPYTPYNAADTETRNYRERPGRKLLRLYITLENDSRHDDVSFTPGYSYIIDTDAGTALAVNGSRRPNNDGRRWNTDLLWEIPEAATVAVLAARPFNYHQNADYNHAQVAPYNIPTLFRIPIPAP